MPTFALIPQKYLLEVVGVKNISSLFVFLSRRLAKSTLLLIPLFGIHYVVFVSLSESITEHYKVFFDLALGSFQVPYYSLPPPHDVCYNT